jgi:DUF438 domain-containing protein
MASNHINIPLSFNQLFDLVKQLPVEQKKKLFKVLQKDDSIMEIPQQHKALVRERIKKSNADNLLDWETIKNTFDGI